MESNKIKLFHKIGVNIARYIVSTVFIFSGFVKIIDPMGFFYKLQDYAIAFNLDAIPSFLLLGASFFLSALEFVVGLYLFFGVRRKISAFISLLLMGVMTPLTLLLAILNPISDCGCFGDALVISNWQTFWKNIILLLLIIFLYRNSRKITRFFSIETNWVVSLYSIFFIFILGFYCLYYLPIIDFRPYKIGVNIPEAMSIPVDAKLPEYETTFIMEKDGVEKRFSLENYPDSTWTYVDSETKLISAGYTPKIENFTITDIEYGDDITDSILYDNNYNFILIAHQIFKADDSNIDLINEIYDYSKDNNYNFICLTSSPIEDIEEWRDKTGAEYPFYHSDDITLKTIIRSNPGLVLLKNGTIYNKWDHHSLPDEFDLDRPLHELELGQIKYRSTKHILLIVLGWYIIPLLVIFGLDKIYQRSKKKREKTE